MTMKGGPGLPVDQRKILYKRRDVLRGTIISHKVAGKPRFTGSSPMFQFHYSRH